MRKKKQILLNEEELKQQRSRGSSPEKPGLLQRMLLSVRRSGSTQALEQTIANLREEVHPSMNRKSVKIGQSPCLTHVGLFFTHSDSVTASQVGEVWALAAFEANSFSSLPPV